MAGAEQPGNKPNDITRLVLKAVDGLPEDEKQAVLEYFVERGIAPPQPPSLGRFVQPVPTAWGPPDQPLFTAQKSMGSEQITIPVRLSEAQHQRLKQWSAEHNFPMAVVVRGLIERFLDSWEERAA